MYIQFQPTKVVQASSVLLRSLDSREMEYLRLLKLLYIADRESLKLTGRPIIGNHAVAMKNGPLHSEIYDLIRGTHAFEQVWSAHISKQGYAVRLVSDPGVLDLSEQEIEILHDVAERHRNDSTWDVVELTHTFHEWRKNYREGTSSPIPLEDILAGVGFSEEDRAAILSDLEEAHASERLFPSRPHVVA